MKSIFYGMDKYSHDESVLRKSVKFWVELHVEEELHSIGKVKAKFSLCLSEHHTMKVYFMLM
jgi:hypothetical protein